MRVLSASLRGTRRRAAGALAGDVALGFAAALGQAPWGLWPLTVGALALALARTAGAPSARAAFWRALAIGTGHFAVALFWIVEPFLVEAPVYGWMAPFALVLTALGGGLFWAVPAALGHRLGRDRRDRALAIAGMIVLSDWLRGWLFTGLPWALAGHVWIDTPAGQLAAWTGGLGLSALTLAAAVLPLWDRGPAAGGRRAGPLRGALLSVLLIAAAWAAGAARLAQPLPLDTGRVVRLVQPNADQTLKWDPDWARVFYDRLLTLSAAPMSGPAGKPVRPDVVIWPETSVPFLLNDAGPALPGIAAAAGAPVLMGIQRAEGQAWFNSLAEVTATGTLGAVYDKFHLVPFGEYIPWGDAALRLGIRAFAAQTGHGYAGGPGAQVMRVAGLPPAQPLICYEAVFDRHLIRGADRPDWLIQVTNDAWFGTWSGPYQHLAQARLRAIQSGLPLMRAANTGVSAAIDPLGRITARLDLGLEGALDAPLPAPLPRTLWDRLGDGPMLAALALMLLWLGWRRWGSGARLAPDLARTGPRP